MLDPSETIRRIPQMNKELAQLLGLLFTDGCVSRKGRNGWRIYFVNKSKSLVKLFRDCMVKVFGLDKERIRIGKRADGFLKAVVNSKEIGNYLVTMFGGFRTLKFRNGKLPNIKLPISKLQKNDCATEFLKVIFSCDGGLCFYSAYRTGKQGGTRWLIRTVFLACSHPQLRKSYSRLLKELGIQTRNVSGDGKIKIETERDIKKFYKLIGFLPGVKITDHSKYWRGYEKEQVLKLMIFSYNNPSKFYNLPKFHLR